MPPRLAQTSFLQGHKEFIFHVIRHPTIAICASKAYGCAGACAMTPHMLSLRRNLYAFTPKITQRAGITQNTREDNTKQCCCTTLLLVATFAQLTPENTSDTASKRRGKKSSTKQGRGRVAFISRFYGMTLEHLLLKQRICVQARLLALHLLEFPGIEFHKIN